MTSETHWRKLVKAMARAYHEEPFRSFSTWERVEDQLAAAHTRGLAIDDAQYLATCFRDAFIASRNSDDNANASIALMKVANAHAEGDPEAANRAAHLIFDTKLDHGHAVSERKALVEDLGRSWMAQPWDAFRATFGRKAREYAAIHGDADGFAADESRHYAGTFGKDAAVGRRFVFRTTHFDEAEAQANIAKLHAQEGSKP